MSHTSQKVLGRLRRKKHIRKSIVGSRLRPRLCVFRSGKHIYAQIVDDDAGHTLASASSLSPELRDGALDGGNKEGAVAVGKLIGVKALEANITSVVFDRNGFRYHGRVAALADAAREAGLQF